jgi:hypothetical protein
MANEYGDMPAVANPFAPDVFADEAVGFEVVQGVIRVSFGAIKMADAVPPSPNRMVVIGRLVLPVEGAQRLALGLFDFLKQQGHDPRALVGSGEMGQAN